jgi:hypothetical protein
VLHSIIGKKGAKGKIHSVLQGPGGGVIGDLTYRRRFVEMGKMLERICCGSRVSHGEGETSRRRPWRRKILPDSSGISREGPPPLGLRAIL